MDVVENNGGQVFPDEFSSPPSSLSDLSPGRSDLHLANHQSTRDSLHFGVSSASPQIPKNSNYTQPPASATSSTSAHMSASEGRTKKTSAPRGPITLPDGTVRERRKPGPKPKPKDPNAPEKYKRKRQKVEAPTSVPQIEHQYQQSLPPQHPAARQSKITDLVHAAPPRAASEVYAAPQHHVAQLGATPSTPTPRPASSGQVFDPIRGEMSSRVSQSPTATTHNPIGNRLAPSANVTSTPVSPNPPMAKPPPHIYQAPPVSTVIPQRASTAAPAPDMSNHTEIDIDRNSKLMKMETGSAGPSSNAPTPPPQKRAKEQPPPLPTGSGLLSGTPFGGITPSTTANGTTGTNIFLTFPLKGQNNVTINFAREVEQKYGFAALHPRLAARKERQRQLAAASNALEKAQGLAGSGDEMSLDLSEPESANEGENGADDASNTNADGKKRRKRRAEDYDRGDEFVDDTELAWEESALMAKDGFFVYSGPLMTESEKSQIIERADGTVKRGRGRGRGGTTRGDGTGRGRGTGTRGSRGGTTVRKPRVTKADRAAMEQEKLEREKMAATLAVKPAQPQMSTYASAATASTT